MNRSRSQRRIPRRSQIFQRVIFLSGYGSAGACRIDGAGCRVLLKQLYSGKMAYDEISIDKRQGAYFKPLFHGHSMLVLLSLSFAC